MGCAYCGGQILPIRRRQDMDFCSPAHRRRYHEKLRNGLSLLAEQEAPPPAAGFVLELGVADPVVRYAGFGLLMLHTTGPPRGPAKFPAGIAPVLGGSFAVSDGFAPRAASQQPCFKPPVVASPVRAAAKPSEPPLPELHGGPFPAPAKTELPLAASKAVRRLMPAGIPLATRPASPPAIGGLPGIPPLAAVFRAREPWPMAAPRSAAAGAMSRPVPAAPVFRPAIEPRSMPDLPAPETELGGAPEAAGAMPAWPLPALPAPNREIWPLPAPEPARAVAAAVPPAFALKAAPMAALPAWTAPRREMRAHAPEVPPFAMAPLAPNGKAATRLPAIAPAQARVPRMPLAPEFLEPRVVEGVRPASRRSQPAGVPILSGLRFRPSGLTARMLPAMVNCARTADFASGGVSYVKPASARPAPAPTEFLGAHRCAVPPGISARSQSSGGPPRRTVPPAAGFASVCPTAADLCGARIQREDAPLLYSPVAVLPGAPGRIAAPGIAAAHKPVRPALFWRNAPARPVRLESYLRPQSAYYMPESTPFPMLDRLELPAEAPLEPIRTGVLDPAAVARAAAKKRRRHALIQKGLAWAALILAAVALWSNGAPIAVAKAVASRQSFRESLAKRASVEHRDNFRSGMEGWAGSREGWRSTWTTHPDGYVRPGQFALFRPSMEHPDYRMEMLAQIERKSVAWAVRAKDPQNYYAVKLTVTKPGPRPMVSLMRYPVIGGKPGRTVETPVRATLQNDTPYRIAVQVDGRRFNASVEGQPVDSWTDEALRSGGVALFSDAGERARLYWIRVTSNDDLLGRFCALLAGNTSPGSAPERHARERFSVFPAVFPAMAVAPR